MLDKDFLLIEVSDSINKKEDVTEYVKTSISEIKEDYDINSQYERNVLIDNGINELFLKHLEFLGLSKSRVDLIFSRYLLRDIK